MNLEKRFCILFSIIVSLSLFINPLYAEKIVVGINQDYKPFVFAEGGKFIGFDIDIIDIISQKLKFEYELFPMARNNLIPSLELKMIDIAIGGVSITRDKTENIIFSIPYFDLGLLIAAKDSNTTIEDINDLNDRVVATAISSLCSDFLRVINVTKLKLFSDFDISLKEMLAGGADAALVDSPFLYYFISTHKDLGLKIAGPLYLPHSYGIAFRKNSKILDGVNEALETMRFDGTYTKIHNKWFNN